MLSSSMPLKHTNYNTNSTNCNTNSTKIATFFGIPSNFVCSSLVFVEKSKRGGAIHRLPGSISCPAGEDRGKSESGYLARGAYSFRGNGPVVDPANAATSTS